MARRFRFAAPVVAAVLIGIAGVALAQPDRKSGGGRQGLETAMKAMDKAAKDLQTTIGDTTKLEANLKQIWTLQRNCIQAKSIDPGKLPGDKTKALGDYRKAQIDLLKLMLKLESETLDGKTSEATATLASIMQAKSAGHEKFGVRQGR